MTQSNTRHRAPLRTRLAERIARHGPISFDQYMVACHYDEAEGYYASGRAVISDDPHSADFTTHPVEFSPLYGAALAEMICAMSEANPPGIRRIISIGPGSGTLDFDILQALRLYHPDLNQRVHYIVLERSPALLRRLKEEFVFHGLPVDCVLGDATRMPFAPLEDAVILSNEVPASLPFCLLVKGFHGFKEIRIDYQKGRLIERLEDIGEDEARDFLNFAFAHDRRYDEGEDIIATVGMMRMMREIRDSLRSGTVILIDYGAFGSKPRNKVRTYPASPPVPWHDLLDRPGGWDLTADVDFQLMAAATGLRTEFVGVDLLALDAAVDRDLLCRRYAEPAHFIPAALHPNSPHYLMLIQTAGGYRLPDAMQAALAPLQNCEGPAMILEACRRAFDQVVRYVRLDDADRCRIDLESGCQWSMISRNPTLDIEEALLFCEDRQLRQLRVRYRQHGLSREPRELHVRQLFVEFATGEIQVKTGQSEWCVFNPGHAALVEDLKQRLIQIAALSD